MTKSRPFPTSLPLFLVALSIAGSSGCSPADPPRPEVVFDSLEGYVVARNGPEGFWRPGEKWTVEEVFRLGTAEGSEEFLFSSPLLSASLGPAGEVFVLDFEFADVRVYDRKGEFLRSFGGHGEGPGELSAPATLTWDPWDRLWIAEAFNGRYTVFDTLGALVKTVPRAMHSVNRLQYPLLFSEDGTFLDMAVQGPFLFPVRVDTAGISVDTLPGFRRPELPSRLAGVRSFMVGEDVYGVVRASLPRLVWALAPDGSYWTAKSGEYRLVHRTADGDTIRVVEAGNRTPEFTSREKELIDRACQVTGRGLSPSDFKKTVVHAIHPLDDGHVLVQIAGEMKTATPLLDVFDPEGRFLGTIDAGFPMEVKATHAFVGDTIIAVTLGELDVPLVVRAEIHRPEGSSGL